MSAHSGNGSRWGLRFLGLGYVFLLLLLPLVLIFYKTFEHGSNGLLRERAAPEPLRPSRQGRRRESRRHLLRRSWPRRALAQNGRRRAIEARSPTTLRSSVYPQGVVALPPRSLLQRGANDPASAAAARR